MGPVDQECVGEQEVELRPSVGAYRQAVLGVGTHRREHGLDAGEVVVLRPQPLEIRSAKRAHQVVG